MMLKVRTYFCIASPWPVRIPPRHNFRRNRRHLRSRLRRYHRRRHRANRHRHPTKKKFMLLHVFEVSWSKKLNDLSTVII